MDTIRLLRRKAASEYLREVHGLERAAATLAKLAVTGDGPVFRRIGRIPLYAPHDLDEWVASNLSPRMHSTSQTASERVGGNKTPHQPNSAPTVAERAGASR